MPHGSQWVQFLRSHDECARTPMQWTGERHGGFSQAKKVERPVIHKGEYGFQQLNAADQRRDPDSILNLTERLIRTTSGSHPILLKPYGWRWYRANAADTTILRSSL